MSVSLCASRKRAQPSRAASNSTRRSAALNVGLTLNLAGVPVTRASQMYLAPNTWLSHASDRGTRSAWGATASSDTMLAQ